MVWENNSTMVLSAYIIIAIISVYLIHKFTKDRTHRISNLRLFFQVAALLAIFMGLLIGPFNTPRFRPLGISPRDRLVGSDFFRNQLPEGLPVPVLACYYPNGRTVTCPLWQIQAYIFPFWDTGIGYYAFYSTSGLEKLAIVFGLVIGMSIILGKIFCGWLCPFGLYEDLITRIRKTLRIKHYNLSERTNNILGQFRFIIIAIFLILSFIFGSYAILGTELIPGTIPGGPLGTEAGIVSLINEPFCLVCPMRPLSILAEIAVGQMNYSYVSQIMYGPLNIAGFYLTSLNITILILITVLSFAFRRFWCRICPLGALVDIFSTQRPFKKIALAKLEKDEVKCTKCGICQRVCPTQVTDLYQRKGGDVTVSRCIFCFRCVEMCPEKDALKLKFAGKTLYKSSNWLKPNDD
jgi:ferredoxin-type protein NapH